MSLTPRQLGLLSLLTLAWGFNWPIMKIGVMGYPPLSFRALSMWIALPLLWMAARVLKAPLRVPRSDWPELGKLTISNMIIWQMTAMFAIQALSSGRASILGYTMPIFSALWGVWLFQERMRARQAIGVLAAGVGVSLLLWHELAHLAGLPWAALCMLAAAAAWALGTQQLRRTRLTVPTMTIVFWMSAVTTVVISVVAVVLEREHWHAPSAAVWGAVLYNAVLIFGFAQPAWLVLARALPPTASTLSVMMIPVLGTVSGAWWLKEPLYWQDGAAIVLMLVAISSVLLPARKGINPVPVAQPDKN